MISYLKGTLTRIEPAKAQIELQGMGYALKISLQTYGELKEQRNKEVFLYAHLDVKEDSLTLYGFREETEKALFLLLISVSGVGPNTALAALSSMGAMELAQALVSEDVASVKSIKGVGPKTAQRLILELKDKAIALMEHTDAPSQNATIEPSKSVAVNSRREAVDALVALGFPKSAAEKSVAAIINKTPDLTTEHIIKQALKTK